MFSLVSAVLAVLPGLEGDLAVAVLDAEVGGVVARLHRASEECPTGWADLKAGSSITLRSRRLKFISATVLYVLGGGF